MRLSQLKTKKKNSKTEIEIDSDSDDTSSPIPSVQTVKGALNLLHQNAKFADYWGCEELSLAVTKVSNILVDLRLKTQKQ